MTDTLYIIGNGFDLHHGLATGYNDFREFIKQKDKSLFDKVDEYICIDKYWYEFEEALSSLDVDHLVGEASNHLHSYSHEDWSDSFHHDFQFEIKEVVAALSNKLHEEFCEWISTIAPPEATESLPINKDSQFLTFNYTSTLEDVYGIKKTKIKYIHGSINDSDDQIVLGHSWSPEERQQLSDLTDEESDTRIIEGYDIVDRYFSSTYKAIDEIINENESYFDGLCSINKVYVLGHSLADVDMGYFHQVLSKVSKNCEWYISYHSENDKIKIGKTIESLKIKNVELIEISDCS